MRITVQVNTIGQEVKEVRRAAVVQLDEYISKHSKKCPECGKLFLSERRKKKKYCGDYCRSKSSSRAALARYYKRKKNKKRKDK